jgi:hypothetical protein
LSAVGLAKIEANIFRGRLVARRRHVEPLNGIGFVSGARLVEIVVGIGELRGEFRDKFDANFIATRANGRTERGEKVGRFATEFKLHAANRFLNDACKCAAPTSVNSGDDAFLRINEENRYAIGSLHAKQKPRGVCKGGVALWRLGGGLREKVNDVGMDLLEREQRSGFGGQSGLEQAAIFCYGFAGIPFHEPKIQNFLSVEDAGCTGARAEAVDEPGNFREGSELQDLQSAGALQRPRGRKGGTARGRGCVLTRAMISFQCFRGSHNLNSIIATRGR